MIEKNDPRLTGFVLGELDASDAQEVSAAIEASSELQHVVAEIEQATQLLDRLYVAEPPLTLRDAQRQELLDAVDQSGLVSKPSASSEGRFQIRWLVASVAAILLCMIGGSIYFNNGLPMANHEMASVNSQPDERVASADEAEDEAGIFAGTEVEKAPPESMKSMATGQRGGQLEGHQLVERTNDANTAQRNQLTRSKLGVPADKLKAESGNSNASNKADLSRSMAQRQMQRAFPDATPGNQANPTDTMVVQPLIEVQGKEMADVEEKTLNQLADLKADADSQENPSPAKQLAFVQPGAQGGGGFGGAGGATNNQLDRGLPDAENDVSRWQSLLDQSELGPLKLQVEARTLVATQEVRTPVQRFVETERVGLRDLGDGSTEQFMYRELAAKMMYKTSIAEVEYVRPVATLATADTEDLVSQLTLLVDPNESQILSLESLLDLNDAVVLFDDDEDRTLRMESKSGELKLAKGGFSKIELAARQPAQVAAIGLLRVMRDQIENSKIDSTDEAAQIERLSEIEQSPSMLRMRQSKKASVDTDGIAMKPDTANEKKPDAAGQSAEEKDQDSNQQSGDLLPKPKRASGQAQKNQSGQAPSLLDSSRKALIKQTLEPNSIDDFDFTQLVLQIKSALKKRNLRVIEKLKTKPKSKK
ncbi:MAG: hypothetical protein AAFN77_07835 [Planctomycetota bacterium]